MGGDRRSGVRSEGVESREWTDHTNVRPTMLALLGLRDDYRSDGRVLVSALRSNATPDALRRHGGTVRALGDVYERLNASIGEFALATLKASTTAIASTDEARYEQIEQAIADLTTQRDALAPQIESDLEAAAFRGKEIDEDRAKAEIAQAEAIVAAAHRLAESGRPWLSRPGAARARRGAGAPGRSGRRARAPRSGRRRARRA